MVVGTLRGDVPAGAVPALASGTGSGPAADGRRGIQRQGAKVPGRHGKNLCAFGPWRLCVKFRARPEGLARTLVAAGKDQHAAWKGNGTRKLSHEWTRRSRTRTENVKMDVESTLLRRGTDMSRASSDVSRALIDISRTPTDISPAPTNISRTRLMPVTRRPTLVSRRVMSLAR